MLFLLTFYKIIKKDTGDDFMIYHNLKHNSLIDFWSVSIWVWLFCRFGIWHLVFQLSNRVDLSDAQRFQICC